MATTQWVMLAYRLPRTPSTPRITLWRKLRRLGVAQIVDGVVALPATADTREQLEWLAEDVVQSGGLAGKAADQRVKARRLGRVPDLVADVRLVHDPSDPHQRGVRQLVAVEALAQRIAEEAAAFGDVNVVEGVVAGLGAAVVALVLRR